MAGDGAFQRIELACGARLQPAVEAVVMRLHGERGVARPVSAPRVAREDHLAVLVGELDGEVVAPVLQSCWR